MQIIFNAFSFLRPRLKRKQIDCEEARLELPEGLSVKSLIERLELMPGEVEGVFVNGKIVSVETVLQNGDRVALVPPGTPGPYRVMLGIVPLPPPQRDQPIRPTAGELAGSLAGEYRDG